MRSPLVPLSSVCKLDRQSIRSGLRPELRYVGMESVEAHTGQLLNGDFSKTPEAPEANSFHFNSTHVLYGKLRPYLNKVYAPEAEGKCSTELIPLRPSEELDRHYLAYFLRTPSSVAAISQKVAGARMPRADMDFVMSMPIPLPTVSEQRRVVELLSRAEGIVRMRRDAEAKNKEIIPALFVDMFGDSARNERGWPVSALDELCQSISDIDHKMPKAVDVGIPFVSAKDLLDDGSLSFKSIKNISRNDFQRLSRKSRPERNDIIYSRIGARLGKARLVEVDFEFLASYSCCTVKPDHNLIDAEFLCQLMDSPSLLQQAHRGVKAIAVPDLGLQEIKAFRIIVPPMGLQKSFATRRSRARSLCSDQQAACAHAERVLQSLLAGVFENNQ